MLDNAASSVALAEPVPAEAAFQPNRLRETALLGRIIAWLVDHPEIVFRPLRLLWPNAQLGSKLVLVTRCEDVRAVLSNPAVFGVPYRQKIETLAGADFILGTDDPAEYRTILQPLMDALSLADIPKVAADAERRAADLVRRAPGEIDAMQDLVTAILAGICERYFGIPVDRPDMFPLWAMAASSYLFAGIETGDKTAEAQAHAAAAHLRAAVDDGIDRARTHPARDTVLGRLVATSALSRPLIRAIGISLTVAIVPTGTMAAGNMLEMLLRNPAMMCAAQAAAHAGDADLLRRCLFEALRFKTVAPFFPRDCKQDYTLAAGTWRARRIAAGTRVLASMQSAMFDGRQLRDPTRFDPGRPATDFMNFGYGLHACLGAALASSVIPAILRPLLLEEGLRAAPGARGRPALFAGFPEHLVVRFDRGAES